MAKYQFQYSTINLYQETQVSLLCLMLSAPEKSHALTVVRYINYLFIFILYL